MGGEKMRTFEFDGKKRGIRLDDGTWQAIDWLADQRGVKWSVLAQEWATLAIQGEFEKGDNLTGVIRSAVMNALLQETILAERAEAYNLPEATGFALAGVCYRSEDFDHAVKQATLIDGCADLTSVEVHTGIDEFGRVSFYVRNLLEGQPSMTIATPFTPDEWRKGLEA